MSFRFFEDKPIESPKSVEDAYNLAMKAIEQKNHSIFQTSMKYLSDHFDQPNATETFITILKYYSPQNLLGAEKENTAVLRKIKFDDRAAFEYRAQMAQNSQQNSPSLPEEAPPTSFKLT